jgi:hypothetical protein
VIGKSADYLERFARFFTGEYIMANKPNQAVVAPAKSAVGSVVEMICGRSLADAKASIHDIGFATQKIESGIGGLVADREVLDSNLLHWVVQSGADGKLLRHSKDHELAPNKFVPIPYPEFLQVREFYAQAAFDAGSESLEGAEKVWERAIQRLVKLDFVRPKSESKDAERMATKRAEQIAKFAEKGEGELLELKAELVAKGDTKSLGQAKAVQAEIERREKPEIDKVVAECKALNETLRKRAGEWAKAGSVDAVERLSMALLALG